MEMGKAIYEATAAQGGADAGGAAPGGAGGASAQAGKGDDVIDAEFEVKDDKK